MSLETGTYISDLVITNPTASDPKSQGDDHLRLVKSTLKNTFPNVTGAVTPTHTELNFVDGVTSAIQTQIDSKGAISGQAWTGTHTFPSTVSFGNVSATEISYLDGVTSAIQTQFDNITGTLIPAKGAIIGQTWTGTHDYTGATLTAATPTAGDSSTKVATTAFASALAFAAALPSQAGNAGKFVTTNGTVASWASLTIPSGTVPIGGLIANKNVGTSFTDAGATWLRTGVIATSATYPLAPTVTINDGATWLSKTGVSLSLPSYASNGTGTVIAVGSVSYSTNYAVSTDYGVTWASAALPASTYAVPVWCGTFFLLVTLNPSSTTFYTSPTGLAGSWTARTVPSNTYINGVYGAQGCIITTNTTQGYITTDGITYTPVTMPAVNLLGCFGNGFYAFVPFNGGSSTTTCYRTYDGINFATKTLPFAVTFSNTYSRPIVYGEGVFLWAQSSAVAKCFTTADFENFTVNNTGIPLTNTYAPAFGNGTFLLNNPTGSSTCYTSDDQGVTWVPRTFISSGSYPGIVFTGTAFAGLESSTTNATQSVSGGTYTDTAKAMFADSPENTRPFYMRVS